MKRQGIRRSTRPHHMADSKKRIALKPHMEQIRAWVDEGKTDERIADTLGTSASSVQPFRSRNDIFRHEQPFRGLESLKACLTTGSATLVMWLVPAVAEDPPGRSTGLASRPS